MARPKPSKKKSLTRSMFYDEVIKYLVNECDWDELKRPMVKDMTMAIANTIIKHSTHEKGCTLPGLGKFYWRLKKARKAGKRINPFTQQEIDVKAKPAMWKPKFRLIKAGRDGMASVQPKA